MVFLVEEEKEEEVGVGLEREKERKGGGRRGADVTLISPSFLAALLSGEKEKEKVGGSFSPLNG